MIPFANCSLPFPQTAIEPFESPVMTSPLGENSKHVKYCGISYFYQINKKSNIFVTNINQIIK